MNNIASLISALTEKKVFTVALLLGILLVGFSIRFDNLGHWLNNQDQYFSAANIPVTLGVDPYYYLDIADDLLHGKLETFDEQRQFPLGAQKPSAAPLLAVLLALLSFVTNQPLEWIAILLPPFLGILLAFPAYLLGYWLVSTAQVPGRKNIFVSGAEARIVGWTAALFALLSAPLVVRSSIGWCDTDILNVTFTTLSIYLAGRFYEAKELKDCRKFFVSWFVTFLGFAWWWDVVLLPIVVLAGSPMVLAVILDWKKSRRFFLAHWPVISGLVVVLLLWKSSSLLKLPEQLFSLFSYIGGHEKNSVFPALEKLVQEQGDWSFLRLASGIAGNFYLYLASIAGLLFLLFIAKKRFLFLLPLLIMNIMAFSAMRFMIFLAPLFGLGVGSVILAVLLLLRKSPYTKFSLVLLLAVAASWPPIKTSQNYNTAKPLLAPVVYEGMREIARITPENSVVWSSWGHGHPLVHYSDRKTIGDGMNHSVALDFVTKFPLAVNSI